MLSLSPNSQSPAELRPARALLTPTWIGALALLVANDHWLKGSGLLPGVLTGKLSDFAGMLVAPVLLAALLGVRTRGALLACHVAVAIVFTGIQLSTGFAAQWSALMGLFGHPWTITCDPTDLLALPFLLVSWKLLVPEMNPELPALVPLQRTAVGALSMFGLWSTVATSVDDGFPDPNGGWYEDVYGSIYINNANEFEIALHIRPLREDVAIDCQQVAHDPGRLLGEAAFGEAVHWSLPARTNVAIEFDPNDVCHAVWVAGEGIDPTILFFDSNAETWPQWHPGQTMDGSSLDSAGFAITFDAEGKSSWAGNEPRLFTPKTETLEQPAGCEAPLDELRIEWSPNLPGNDVQVLAVEAGVDGCFELEVQEMYMPNGEVETLGAPYKFYLCVPAATMPFAADEFLRFAGGGSQLWVTLLDGATLEPQVSDEGSLIREVFYVRGASMPEQLDTALGKTLYAIDRVSCPWLVEAEGCASVERPVDLAFADEPSYLQPGVPVSYTSEQTGMLHTVVLGHARQLAVIDPACGQDSSQLRYGIDLAIVYEPL
jgi:hypothetical protein